MQPPFSAAASAGEAESFSRFQLCVCFLWTQWACSNGLAPPTPVIVDVQNPAAPPPARECGETALEIQTADPIKEDKRTNKQGSYEDL